MANGRILGIDLGTKNSSIAVWEDGDPTRIPMMNGDAELPPFISLTDYGVVVENPAGTGGDGSPERKVNSYKHRLATDEPEISFADEAYPALKVAATVLYRLKRSAEAYLDEDTEKAVIGVPAHFDEYQRQGVRDAANAAGLQVERLISEPAAAALAYECRSANLVLVFDLGAASLSVSVLDLEGDALDVLAMEGSELGGMNWVREIFDWLAREFESEVGVNLRENRRASVRLWQLAEEALIDLSNCRSDHSRVTISFTISVDGESVTFERDLSMETFASLTDTHLDRAMKLIQQVLSAAGRSPGEIDETILAGGSGRIPRIEDALTNVTGKRPRRDGDPTAAVALGAAVEGRISTKPDAEKRLFDVLPRSLGVEMDGGRLQWLVKKNTPIPDEGSAEFTSNGSNGGEITCRVYQSDRTGKEEGRLLHEFSLAGGSVEKEADRPLEVALAIDGSEEISVRAGGSEAENATRMTIGPEELGRPRSRIEQLRREILGEDSDVPSSRSVAEPETRAKTEAQNPPRTDSGFDGDERSLPDGVIEDAIEIRSILRKARRWSGDDAESVTQGIEMTIDDFEDLLDQLSNPEPPLDKSPEFSEHLLERFRTLRNHLKRLTENETGTETGERIRTTLNEVIAELDTLLESGDVSLIDPEPGTEIDPRRHRPLNESDRPEEIVDSVRRAGFERDGSTRWPARVMTRKARGKTASERRTGEEETAVYEPIPPDIEGFQFDASERSFRRDAFNDLYPAVTDDGRDVAVAFPRFEISVDAFERAARRWNGLGQGEHVVSVVGWDTEPCPWIAFDHPGRGDLSKRIDEIGYQRAVRIAVTVARGLANAHELDVTHGNLTPESIHFPGPTDATPVISNWGWGTLCPYRSPGFRSSSIRYAAPEQLDPDRYGPPDDRTDVYRFGAVVFELFTGKAVFDGPPAKVMNDVLTTQPESPTAVDPTLPTEIDAVLERTLRKEKDRRYQSVAELLDDLRGLQQE